MSIQPAGYTATEKLPGSSPKVPRRFESVCIERVLAALESATGASFCIHAVVFLRGRLDENLLARSARLTLDQEPVFQCRFVEGWWQPYWRPRPVIRQSQFFESIDDANAEQGLHAVLARDLDAEREYPVKVFLIRGSCDVLCVKLDHKMGDGYVVKNLACRLADTYSRLTLDDSYTPPFGGHIDRTVMQITRKLSNDQQQRILRDARAGPTQPGALAEWHLPPPNTTHPVIPCRQFQVRTIPAAQSTATLDYARTHRVTPNTVLLAAFARAAVHTIDRSPGPRSHILQSVDLRRHLDDRETAPHCNLSSLLTLTIDQTLEDPLESYVASLGRQMQAARTGYMGLAHPLIRWEINPRRRFLFNCIPFRAIKRMARRRIRQLDRARSPARLVFSNAGSMDPGQLKFAGVTAQNAFAVPGTLTPRKLWLLAATEFEGRWNLAMAYAPQLIDPQAVTAFLDAMEANLPR